MIELEALEPPEFHARRPPRHVCNVLQTFAAVKQSPRPSSASHLRVESTHALEWIDTFRVAAFRTLCDASSGCCSKVERGAFLRDGGLMSNVVGETKRTSRCVKERQRTSKSVRRSSMNVERHQGTPGYAHGVKGRQRQRTSGPSRS